MAWLSRLFARSPFGPIKEHQYKVAECAALAEPILEACMAADQQEVRQLARQISTLEQESDAMKNEVRDGLPKGLLMPVSRGDLLNVLSVQDSIADAAEDLGVLLTMREMEPLPDAVAELLRQHVRAALAVVDQSTEVVEQLDRLVKAAFAGPEARRVLEMIDQLDRKEHEADKIQDQLAKAFFAHEDAFKPAAIYLWMKIFNKVGDLANFAEKLGHRVRLFLAHSG